MRRHRSVDPILDAALAVVDNAGPDALTLAAVAGRTRVAPPSLYKHVGSIAELRARIAVERPPELLGTVAIYLAPLLNPDGRARALASPPEPGRHNAANAAAAAIALFRLGYGAGPVARALAGYEGVRRRQEVVGEFGGVLVVDDFAHHPTAIEETIAAMRARYPGRRLRAVFEPRSNTSRRAVFQKRFTEALACADAVAVSAVYAKENDPLRPEEMLSTERLVADLRAKGVEAWAARDPDAILERLAHEVRAGEVVLCMSNGSFANLPRRLVQVLGERRAGVAV